MWWHPLIVVVFIFDEFKAGWPRSGFTANDDDEVLTVGFRAV